MVLAACRALHAMARLHTEDLARSRYIDVLFRAQAGQVQLPTSPRGTPLPLPPGQAKAMMPPDLKSELAQLEQVGGWVVVVVVVRAYVVVVLGGGGGGSAEPRGRLRQARCGPWRRH